ncbi:MAG: B12-binding domain-containing protein [Ignavibacteriales bacterium]|nr:B12-binding domain-containing protein [Ignavibacteriales bacterium]
MKDQPGADELARQALDEGVKPDSILEDALIPAMAVVGNKFSRQEIFVPADADVSQSNEQCNGSS